MAIRLGSEDGTNRYLKRKGIIIGSVIAAVVVVVLALYSFLKPDFEGVCVQYDAIVPSDRFHSAKQFLDSDYVELSAQLLRGAVQIPTETFDDMKIDVLKDKRFLVFNEFHDYLAEKFPLATQFRETVNHYGLLYTFPGSDKSLKPIVLMAHQDVVPVNRETTDKWAYPPFEGHYDGEFLYGRGAADTKNSLIAQLEAVEALLLQKWEPKRTVLLSYGFDEEITGARGAKHLAQTIRERYGKHGVETIVDEGFGIMNFQGTQFSMPAVTEKGRIEFDLSLLTPGGHSSMPPDHTGIGIMASLVADLEANPLEPYISEDSPLAEFFGCFGRWTENLPLSQRVVFGGLKHKKFRNVLASSLQNDPKTRYLVRSSQAVDVIKGGVKVNALPEKVVLQVDHRIAIHQDTNILKARIVTHIKELAKKFDLGVDFDGQHLVDGNYGALNVTSGGHIEPAPVAATKGHIWEVLAGTSKHVFEEATPFFGEKVYFGPSMMPANTDTAHYWDVSRNIYRYNPSHIDDMIDYHTINERLRFRSHITAVAWFYEYIINWTE